MVVKFYDLGEVEEELLRFAVINSTYNSSLVLVRHKERETWEIPGGRREQGEDIAITAERELYEETGATSYRINPICDYSVETGVSISYGRLFDCEIYELSKLAESEIGEVRMFEELPTNLTYPEIQPYLRKEIANRKNK